MHSDAQFEGSQGFLALHRDRMHSTYAGPVFFMVGVLYRMLLEVEISIRRDVTR